VNVDVFSGGAQVVQVTTAANGTYVVGGLTPGSNYSVCFDASVATGGTSTTGYADQCYNGVAWDGVSTTTGTAVAVAAGVPTTGIDGSLADAVPPRRTPGQSLRSSTAATSTRGTRLTVKRPPRVVVGRPVTVTTPFSATTWRRSPRCRRTFSYVGTSTS
jgi:hypothetical protein